MRNLYNYPIGEKLPDEFNVIIEVPQGSNNKYEYNLPSSPYVNVIFILTHIITGWRVTENPVNEITGYC